MKKHSTSINEKALRMLEINRDEYALCDYVLYRCADSRQKKAGYCCDSKADIADFVIISRPGLYKMIDRLVLAGLIDVDAPTGFLRVTPLYYDTVNGCKQSLQDGKKDSVNLVDTDCKLSLHENENSVNLVTPIYRNSKSIISKKELEEKERAKRASLIEKKFHQKPLKERLNEVSIYAKEKNAPAAFFALIESPDFATLWEEYMAHRKKYKAKAFIEPRTEFAAIMKLFTFAGFKMEIARKVVERSFDNGWQGFFELPKGENAAQNKTAPAPAQYEPPKEQPKKLGLRL